MQTASELGRGVRWTPNVFTRGLTRQLNDERKGEKETMKFATRMGRLGTESAFEVLARAKALEAQG
jgi:hypothetical protein